MGVTSLVGAQWGSEGKGVIAAGIAGEFDAAVRVGGPNAGHSFYHGGKLYKMRGVPCAWVNRECRLYIGPGAVINAELLERELSELPWETLLFVDERATVVTHEHEHAETELVKAIGSTGEGVGQARIAKIRRDGSAVLAGDYPWTTDAVCIVDSVDELSEALGYDSAVMLEGTQGSGLSLHHGTQYPKVTSQDTNVSGLLSEAGIAPQYLAHSMLVARTFPIRVAGPSGPMGEELDWQRDFIDKGIVEVPEQTTVSHKTRRISRWFDPVFERALMLNRPCGVWLTFGDYLVPALRGVTDPQVVIDSPAGDFARDIERRFGVPVIGIGMGPVKDELGNVVDFAVSHIGRCGHGEDWLW